MTELTSFPEKFNVAIIGASGGIGQAFSQIMSQHPYVGRVYKFSRSGPKDIKIDICKEESVKRAAESVDLPVHLIILATGLLHEEGVDPEKSLRDLDPEKMKRVFEINTIGPALVAKHFMPLLPRTKKSVFAALSARVGSISDNGLGGWYSYRASKAALNMIIKNVAIETARKHKETAVIGLHPGTVDTGLSLPFQSQVKKEKLFSPEQSAQYLLGVLNQINFKDTGKVFAWDGKEVQA